MTRGSAAHSAVLFVDPKQHLKIMLQLHLNPDPAGEITLLQPFGLQCRWTGLQPEGLSLADPLLTFADLKARTEKDVATQLYQQYLSPRFAG